jgi:DNA-binding MarR family transcriptional regulator
MDITKEELVDNGKKRALELIKNSLELAGLDPSDYDLSLRKKSNPKSAPNIQVFQTAAYLAATCLSPSAAKIFLYFLSMSEFENYVGVSHQDTIAEDTGIKKRTVVDALKELTDNGIIIKTANIQDKRLVDYWLNPMSAWKGKTLNRKIALQKIAFENKNQLHLFGETYEDNILREAEEIKKKRPNLFLSIGK